MKIVIKVPYMVLSKINLENIDPSSSYLGVSVSGDGLTIVRAGPPLSPAVLGNGQGNNQENASSKTEEDS